MKTALKSDGQIALEGRAACRIYPRPTKEEVRHWLRQVVASGRPPPSVEEIQRDLWHRRTVLEPGSKS